MTILNKPADSEQDALSSLIRLYQADKITFREFSSKANSYDIHRGYIYKNLAGYPNAIEYIKEVEQFGYNLSSKLNITPKNIISAEFSSDPESRVKEELGLGIAQAVFSLKYNELEQLQTKFATITPEQSATLTANLEKAIKTNCVKPVVLVSQWDSFLASSSVGKVDRIPSTLYSITHPKSYFTRPDLRVLDDKTLPKTIKATIMTSLGVKPVSQASYLEKLSLAAGCGGIRF
jgi:hypothetical protein